MNLFSTLQSITSISAFRFSNHKQITRIEKVANFYNINVQSCKSYDDYQRKYIQWLQIPNAKFYDSIRHIKYTAFFEANSKYKIIELTKQVISKNYPRFTDQCQQSINNFFTHYSSMINQYNMSLKYKEQANSSAIQTMVALNQFFPLTSSSKINLLNYLRNSTKIENYKKGIHISEWISNYRICTQQLMSLPLYAFSDEELIKILTHFWHSNIAHLHYDRSLDVIKYFWNGIDKEWHKKPNLRIQIVKVLERLSCFSEDIISKVQQIMQNHLSDLTLLDQTELLNFMLKFKAINANNYKSEKYIKAFRTILSNREQMNRFFGSTCNNMYRAGIWNEDYWLNFFQMQKSNGFKVNDYHMGCIFRIIEIDVQMIPNSIIIAARNCKENYQKGYDPSRDSESKDYEESKLSCQNQLSNSLKMSNVGTVKTELPIQFFTVDIVVNDKLVIQVNGNTHHLFDIESKAKTNNIKTQFRSRVLRKLGYEVLDVKLEDYNEGSFQIIDEVHRFVDQMP